MSGESNIVSELFSDENTCPSCSKYRAASCAFCPTCGEKNRFFKESSFWAAYEKSLSQARVENCLNSHAGIKKDARRTLEGEPLFCDLCGEQIIFSS